MYQREVEKVSEEVRNGKSLSSSVGGEYTERRIRGDVISAEETAFYARKLECFPIELSMAVKVGEQTGSLASMLKKTGDRYDREIDSLIKNLSSMLEPIIILFIGSVVGVIVLAVMMPFFNMANVIH